MIIATKWYYINLIYAFDFIESMYIETVMSMRAAVYLLNILIIIYWEIAGLISYFNKISSWNIMLQANNNRQW